MNPEVRINHSSPYVFVNLPQSQDESVRDDSRRVGVPGGHALEDRPEDDFVVRFLRVIHDDIPASIGSRFPARVTKRIVESYGRIVLNSYFFLRNHNRRSPYKRSRISISDWRKNDLLLEVISVLRYFPVPSLIGHTVNHKWRGESVKV